ncbi:hypothetical protein PCANC_06680 [Puccinia coronata f. sp. avenae]|uniref:Uncharacterized protein n=1 Tax=Puccinia coronata f. sp. avenae TaxID=200324 RepID=A0A2N5VUB0_9BASI|nr:hypothetical protein PCANC_06680 [Puccinia coronata f. sp. avenae]
MAISPNSSVKWFQQLPAVFSLIWSGRSQQLMPMLPTAAAFQLLELLVSQTEIDAPNSWSCRSQQLELSVSASETNGSSCWNRWSRKLRPMQIPAAEAVGLSK